LTLPVRLSSLAAQDFHQARNWFDQREAGLGDRFLESVEQTRERISTNADQYQVALLDLHRAPIRPFQYSLWYRVMPEREHRRCSAVGPARPVAGTAADAADRADLGS
jgi:hypothetical protein